MVHVVAYDLKKPHETWRDYQRLWDALRAYGCYCHLEESVWLVKTGQTTAQVRDHLWEFMYAGDKLFVAQLQGNAAWIGLDAERSNWIQGALS